MKEMTTAEFAKANLAALEETVTIRRYTQVIGTYYPKGFEPAAAPELVPPTLGLEEIAPESVKATQKIVEDLTEEVAHLKRELAKARQPTYAPQAALPDGPPVPGGTTAIRGGKYVREPRRDDDPFAGLAKQDREFFERKLGTGKKKS